MSESGDIGKLFRAFFEANDLQEIVSTFRAVCRKVEVNPDQRENFYQTLKERLHDWRCDPLWPMLDERLARPVYEGQSPCKGRRLLVVGAGPIGLRMAIEGIMLGAEVDVVEKRESFTRNNVVHLWPFVVQDLKELGAKHFHSRFCSGSIHHAAIRLLQVLLLKTCLLLGVKIHFPVSFQDLIEPQTESDDWRVLFEPPTTPLSSQTFDSIIAADGKQYCLPGFTGKEFRAKLAIGITMNFVNNRKKSDILVEEIGGWSYHCDQAFFNKLAKDHGIELENIVYYKDETHYFVMTAKKSSLLEKGVLLKDYPTSGELLSRDNVCRDALVDYAKEAALYTTKGGLGELVFAPNYRGDKDVAMFDFTGMMYSDNASKILERKGKKLLLGIAGDSLFESFWPTGSGMGRGVLGVFDAAWMFKRFCQGDPPLEVVKEREGLFNGLRSVFSLVSNTNGYTIDPVTRYGLARMSSLSVPQDTSQIYDTDAV